MTRQFQRRVPRLRTINQAHIHKLNDHPLDNETLDLYREGATLSKFILEGRPTTTKRLSLLFDPSDEIIRRLYGIPGQ